MPVTRNPFTLGRPKTLERDHVRIAALYPDGQTRSAMPYQKEGICNKVIAELLRTGFTVLR